MSQINEVNAIRIVLERFMPPDMWRHDITIKDGIATVDSTYLEPINKVTITVSLKGGGQIIDANLHNSRRA